MDNKKILEVLKQMLGFAKDEADEERDSLLQSIILNTLSRLKLLLGGTEPPEDMQYIVVDVSIKRFNRIGSEGLSSHSVEGESNSYAGNDFDEFKDDINAFLEAQKDSNRGKLRFL